MFEDASEDADVGPRQQQKAATQHKAPAAKQKQQAANGSKKRAQEDAEGLDIDSDDAAPSRKKGNSKAAAAKPAKVGCSPRTGCVHLPAKPTRF